MPRLEVEQLTPKTFEKGAARASLYLGDCRKVLPTLPPADYCVITDPPWPRYHPDERGIEGTYSEEAWRLFEEVIERLPYGVRRIVVILGIHTDPAFLDAIPRKKWPFQRVIWLRKRVPTKRGPLLVGARVAYLFGQPYVKPNCRVWPGECWDDYHPHERRFGHPFPTPYKHAAFLVTHFSTPDQVVLDPFAGSGQIVRAALEYGRSAVGIEIDEGRLEEAAKALFETCRAPTLFESLDDSHQTIS